MNNSMKFFKRLTAFLLAMLLVTTMMGDDFSSLADESTEISTSSEDSGGESSDSEPAAEESAPVAESAPASEPAAAEPASEASEPVSAGEEDPGNEVEEIPQEPADSSDVNETTPEEQVDENDADNSTDENIVDVEDGEEPTEENPEEELTEEEKAELERLEQEKLEKEELEEEECEHSWIYISNGDGTHTIKCQKCGEIDRQEDCTLEDHICIHCGYEEEVVEEECEHEWEYISNDDGTHSKRCLKCGEEEIEDCDFDEDWVCILCGYEDMSLTYQSYSKTLHGVKVTVAGSMPRKSEVTIYYKGTKAIESIVNDNLDEGIFTAFAAYDINIYDRHGNKYQPEDDDNTVKVTFENVEEVAETDEEIVVYRIEDDNSITEIQSNTSGENVTFEAEHFTTYVTGSYSDADYKEFASYEHFGTIMTPTVPYTKVLYATFDLYVDDIDDTYQFTAKVYKNSTTSSLTSGTEIASGEDTINPTRTGWMTVEIPMQELVTGNGYVSSGQTYAIVVACNTSIKVGYDLYDGYDCPTYKRNSDLTSWSSTGLNKILYLSTEGNTTTEANASLKEATIITEDISVSTIELSRAKNGNNKYIFAKGETDTLTATLSQTGVERTITWSSGNSNVATATPTQSTTGEMTATFTAVSTGETTITASYNNGTEVTTASITVVVIDLLIGGVSATDSTGNNPVSSTDSAFDYKGSDQQVRPTVTITNGNSDTISSSTIYSNCVNAGTAKAVITVTSYGTPYQFERYYTINPLNIEKTITVDAESRTAFSKGVYVIQNQTVQSATNINVSPNNPLTVTPVFGTDFTVAVGNPSVASTGITYPLTITGQGNFIGTVSMNYKPTDLDAGNYFIAVISLDKTYDGTAVTDDMIWAATKFYDAAGNELANIITSSNATITVTDTAASDENVRIDAGTKMVAFTMTGSGYSGSVETTFEIKQAELGSTTIVFNNGTDEFDHTGNPIEPVSGDDVDSDHPGFRVYLGYVDSSNKGFEINSSDYTVSYVGDHTKITDTPKVRITSTGDNFESGTTQEKSYTIKASFDIDLVVRITNGTVHDGSASNSYVTGYSRYYDGTDTVPNISVRLGGNPLTYDTDYTYTVYDSYTSSESYTTRSKNAGTKYIVVTGKGSYANKQVIATYEITARPITTNEISVIFENDSSKTKVDDKIFTGVSQTLSTAKADDSDDKDLAIKYGTSYLEEGTDYEIAYPTDTTNVGTKSYTITGKGNFTSTLSGTNYQYDITQATIGSSAVASLADAEVTYIYDGTAKRPSVKVVIGNTFAETFVYDSTKPAVLETDNFTVDYTNNISPTTSARKAVITITGRNNLTGSSTIDFDIVSNTTAYTAIYIGGTNLATFIKEENGVRYYSCSSLVTTYTGSKYRGTPTIYHSTSTDPLTRGTDYDYTLVNGINANTDTTYTSTSPYFSITGLGKFAGNDAIVYFNIQKADIKNATFGTFASSYDWDGTTIPKPTVDITFNSKTLTSDSTDKTKLYGYSVAYYDTYDETTGTGTDATAKAGTKYAVFTGVGNFTGEVVKTYTVGKTLDDVYVQIKSGYYDTTYNPEIFISSGEISSTPFDITWRNGKAPIITLGTLNESSVFSELASGAYSLSTPTSSNPALFNEGSGTLYDSRAAGSDGECNVLTYTATPNSAAGYYGDPITFSVQINPQDIATSGSRMSTTTSMEQVYTGDEASIEPVFKFVYGTSTQIYTLVGGDDFTPNPVPIGTNVGSYTSTAVSGVGNFTGTQTLTFNITKGYVQVRKGNTVTSSVKVGETDSTATSYTFDLGDDESTDYYTSYTYDGTEKDIPPVFLTATNGITQLNKDSEYTVTYYNDGVEVTDDSSMSAFKKNVGIKTIRFSVTGSNFVAQTIDVTYEIKSNSIENYSAKISNITYAGEAVTPAKLKEYISSNNATISVAKDTETTETLTYGTDSSTGDYYIVTDAAELASITGATAIAGANNEPSIGEAYVYIHGNLPYSGYKKITFNIQLDITSEYAKVTIPSASYNLPDTGDAVITPAITYQTPDDVADTTGLYSGTITTPLNWVTVSRDRVDDSGNGLPGPDGSITVKGNSSSICIGTVSDLKYADTDDEVYFLADLSTYSGISMTSGTVYSFTGNPVTPTISIEGLEDVEQASVTLDENDAITIHTGAYAVVYKASDGLSYKNAIKAGSWEAIVVPGNESKYFKQGTSKSLSFNIKYNLNTATMTFADPADMTTTPPQTGYTGSPYSFAQKVTITAVDGVTKIYDYDSSITSYVAITPDARTNMGTYTVSATITDTDMVYGAISSQFKISGVSLENATITLEYDEIAYSGKANEPGTTVVVNGVTLTKNSDYKVSYSSNINAGTATVTVTGMDNYSGTAKKTFTITQKALSDCTITVGEAYYIGNDSSLKLEPTISVKNGDVTLTAGTDYAELTSSDYVNNSSIATSVLNKDKSTGDWTWPEVTITAVADGNYSGTARQTFEIKKLDLTRSEVTISPDTTEYTGATINQYDIVELSVTYNGTTTKLTKYDSSTGLGDYTITVQNSAGAASTLTAKDTYTLVIDGKNSCENTITMPFKVTERSLPDNYHYYYTAERAKVGTWEYQKDLYSADEDTTPGYYTYGGETGDGLQIKIPDVETVTSSNIPAVTIIDTEAYQSDGVTKGRTLYEGTDFTLSVNSAAATAGTGAWNKDGAETKHATVPSTSPAVTITGMGDYTGSITIPFNVGKNINNMGLTITYKVSGVADAYTYNEDYDNPSDPAARWHYTYNGVAQTPTVTVKNGTQTLVRNKDYTLTFTDANGDTDTSTSAGWKNVVVTGINNYSGSMSQMYAIDRKTINATGGPFTTESTMNAVDSSGNAILEFRVTGNAVKRFTSDTATSNLYNIYLQSEDDVADFVGFYYAIYNGTDVKPSVSVYDNTLGSNGTTAMVIDQDTDLNVEWPTSSTVATFTLDGDGKLASYTCSDIVISFKNSASGATDFTAAGNYYVPSGAVEYKIRYIILQDDMSDFVVEFDNEFNSAQFEYDEGKAIAVGDHISVKKGALILDEGIDYEVTYNNKTYTNDDGTTFRLASNILPGEGSMKVSGIGKYRSSQDVTFYINGNLDDTAIYTKDDEGNYVLDTPIQQYTGRGITYGDPRLYLILPAQNAHSDNQYILRAGIDYEVDTASYSSSSNFVTDGYLEYKGLSTAYWSGTKSVSYAVEFDADNVTATNYESSYYWTGYDIEPKFGLSIPTAEIKSIVYTRDGATTTDFVSLGTIKATIAYAIGDKGGTVDAEYAIVSHPLSDTDNVIVSYNDTQRYTGRSVKPPFTVWISSTDLQTGDENPVYTLTLYDEDTATNGQYDVDYGSYIYSEGGYSDTAETIGKGQFVLTPHDGVNVISGSRTCTYAIQLQSVVALDATDTGDTITATWVKDLFSDGTDLVLQKLNSSGEYEDKVTHRATGSTQTYTFTDLESSSRYRIIAKAYAFTPSSELIHSEEATKDITTSVAKDKLDVDTSVAGRATITWPKTGNVKLYYVYRTDTDTDEEILCAVIPRSTGTYTNTKVESGKTYIYRIVGYALVDKVLEQVNESVSDPVTIQ